MFTTPLGSPAPSIIFANSRAVKGVKLEGFKTTVFPARASRRSSFDRSLELSLVNCLLETGVRFSRRKYGGLKAFKFDSLNRSGISKDYRWGRTAQRRSKHYSRKRRRNR